jgi:hypothetical protein
LKRLNKPNSSTTTSILRFDYPNWGGCCTAANESVLTREFREFVRKKVSVRIKFKITRKGSTNRIQFTEEGTFVTEKVHEGKFVDSLAIRDGSGFGW